MIFYVFGANMEALGLQLRFHLLLAEMNNRITYFGVLRMVVIMLFPFLFLSFSCQFSTLLIHKQILYAMFRQFLDPKFS